MFTLLINTNANHKLVARIFSEKVTWLHEQYKTGILGFDFDLLKGEVLNLGIMYDTTDTLRDGNVTEIPYKNHQIELLVLFCAALDELYDVLSHRDNHENMHIVCVLDITRHSLIHKVTEIPKCKAEDFSFLASLY